MPRKEVSPKDEEREETKGVASEARLEIAAVSAILFLLWGAISGHMRLEGPDQQMLEGAAREVRDAHYMAFGALMTSALMLVGCAMVLGKYRLAKSRRALSDTLESIRQGVVLLDARGVATVVNGRAFELLGMRIPRKGEEPDPGEAMAAAAVGEPGQVTVVRMRDGKVLEVDTKVLDDGRMVKTITDVTERLDAERKLLHLAQHDPLTDLPNRALLSERLLQAVRSGEGTAALCLDLDRFKAVNDTLGHAAGDKLLVQVSRRLQTIVGPKRMVARTGGDEFVVLTGGNETQGSLTALASNIVEAICMPFDIGGQPVLIGTSVGIARHPHDAVDADGLLRAADAALYRAKSEGRSSFRLYDSEMTRALIDKRDMEADLRAAMGNGELHLHYQPLFDCLQDGDVVCGFEALLRWDHPQRGSVPPSVFIPVAEESGLIGPIGLWVLETACAAAASWSRPCRVAVNLSPAQFRIGHLPGEVSSILGRTGLPASRLELEVTETLMIKDPDQARGVLADLKRVGVTVALDDFGAGFSGLSYLHNFEFDRLKVDRAFVRTMATDTGARSLVRAILAMARKLGIKVTAEGVETEEQLRLLRGDECDQVQGFLLGKPMPPAEVEPFLAAHGRWRSA